MDPSSDNAGRDIPDKSLFGLGELHPAGEGMTKAQAEASQYLKEKKIFDLFNYLIGHLLVAEPEDPVSFLINLLDKCMLFRAGLSEPPLLFTPVHVQGLYRSLDPSGLGYISLEQYRTGMVTMNIENYDQEPITDEKGNVPEQVFLDEAKRRLTDMLTEMIQKPT